MSIDWDAVGEVAAWVSGLLGAWSLWMCVYQFLQSDFLAQSRARERTRHLVRQFSSTPDDKRRRPEDARQIRNLAQTQAMLSYLVKHVANACKVCSTAVHAQVENFHLSYTQILKKNPYNREARNNAVATIDVAVSNLKPKDPVTVSHPDIMRFAIFFPAMRQWCNLNRCPMFNSSAEDLPTECPPAARLTECLQNDPSVDAGRSHVSRAGT